VKALGDDAMTTMIEFQLKAGERAHRRILRRVARIPSLVERKPSPSC
jgi:hypothetical protein